MGRFFLAAGALFGLIAVIALAMGAHLDIPDVDAWQTAARLLMYHAIVLVVLGLVRTITATGPARSGAIGVAGGLFILGALLFSGSIFAGQLTGLEALGRAAPVGGSAMMLGWLSLFLAALIGRGPRND